LGQSLLQVLAENPNRALGDIAFDRDFPATGLPLIERRAESAAVLGGRTIRTGDRLRLFLDAAGFDGSETTVFSELYFATGKHKCPGMNFSRRCWKILANRLSQSSSRMRLVETRQRKGDNVFNLAEAIEVTVHA
jgi:cytochrome P450